MTTEADIQAAAAQAVERTRASLVRVGRPPGRGAGIVLRDGRVLTNAHNLRDRTTTVTFADGTSAQGAVVGADPDGDLVVLAVDHPGATPLPWPETPPEAPLGSLVLTVTPLPGESTRVTVGRVSALNRAFRGPRGRRIEGGLEHTAPVSRGSSGSPVLTLDGQLLGLNTHRLGEGFYLAQPATAELKGRVDALAEGVSPTTRRLGVALAPAHAARRLRAAVGLEPRDGLLVRGVEDDSPAAGADLRAGDLLIEANGEATTSADALYQVLSALPEGASLGLRVLRGAEELSLTATFPAS